MHHVFTEADVRAGRLVNPASRLGDVITSAPNPKHVGFLPVVSEAVVAGNGASKSRLY